MDNITYEGHVSIRNSFGKHIKNKNNGAPLLFNTICDILGSILINDMSALPGFMTMIKGDMPSSYSPDYDNVGLLLTDAPISSKVSSEGHLILSSMLPKSYINVSRVNDLGSSDDCNVVLLSRKKQVLAYSSFKFSEIESVVNTSDGQLIIDWELSFDNRE